MKLTDLYQIIAAEYRAKAIRDNLGSLESGENLNPTIIQPILETLKPMVFQMKKISSLKEGREVDHRDGLTG